MSSYAHIILFHHLFKEDAPLGTPLSHDNIKFFWGRYRVPQLEALTMVLSFIHFQALVVHMGVRMVLWLCQVSVFHSSSSTFHPFHSPCCPERLTLVGTLPASGWWHYLWQPVAKVPYRHLQKYNQFFMVEVMFKQWLK